MLSSTDVLIKTAKREDLPDFMEAYGEECHDLTKALEVEAKEQGIPVYSYINTLYKMQCVWAVSEDGYDTNQVFVADHNLTDDEQLKQCIDFSKEKGYNIYQMSKAGRCGESFWLKVAELAGETVLHVSHLGVVDSYSYEVYSYQAVEEESYEDSYYE